MFSGIVEAKSSVLDVREGSGTRLMILEKPSFFKDIGNGDSLAVDGVCLTLEAHDGEQLQFCLGPETQRVTGWTAANVKGRAVNLERSLRMGDRIHGHLVTGHVDARVQVLDRRLAGECLDLMIELPAPLRKLVWTRGSIAVNGVSLTVNQVDNAAFGVGLIPETLRRTNLGSFEIGDGVNLEVDNLARGLARWMENARREGNEWA